MPFQFDMYNLETIEPRRRKSTATVLQQVDIVDQTHAKADMNKYYSNLMLV